MRKILSFLLAIFMVFLVSAECFALTDASLLGDANLDGIVNIKDATSIQKHLAGLSSLDNVGGADVDGDGYLNIKDATMIQKYIADLAEMYWNELSPEWIGPAYAQMSGKGTLEVMDGDNGVTGNFAYTCIPVKAGEKYIIKGKHYYHSFCYALVNSENKIVRWDEYSDKEVNEVSVELTVESDEVYLYVNRVGLSEFSKQCFAVVKDEKPLFDGKKIVYDGDSICFGIYGGGGYAKLISEQTGCTYENFAEGGALLSSTTDERRHSVVDNLENLPADGDLYCFEGGINDYWKNIPLGTFDECDYTSEVDKTTVCGAIETIFRYCKENFTDKHVCFVIVHKVQKTAIKENNNGDTFTDFHDAMVGICKKYSVPYYDAFVDSELNGADKDMSNKYLTGNIDGQPDGCHPNEEGYKKYYVPMLIELFKDILNK